MVTQSCNTPQKSQSQGTARTEQTKHNLLMYKKFTFSANPSTSQENLINIPAYPSHREKLDAFRRTTAESSGPPPHLPNPNSAELVSVIGYLNRFPENYLELPLLILPISELIK